LTGQSYDLRTQFAPEIRIDVAGQIRRAQSHAHVNLLGRLEVGLTLGDDCFSHLDTTVSEVNSGGVILERTPVGVLDSDRGNKAHVERRRGLSPDGQSLDGKLADPELWGLELHDDQNEEESLDYLKDDEGDDANRPLHPLLALGLLILHGMKRFLIVPLIAIRFRRVVLVLILLCHC